MYNQHTTIRIINVVDPARLAEVKEEMAVLGAPEIRVVDLGEDYFALEGSHRLTAAVELGIRPTLIEVGKDEEIDCEDFDWWEFLRGSVDFEGTKITAEEAVCLLISTGNDFVSMHDL